MSTGSVRKSIILLSFIIFMTYILLTSFQNKNNPESSSQSPSSWNTWADQYGMVETYKLFKENNTKTKLEEQHGQAHLFGEFLYKKKGLEGIKICDDAFSFGCYHSFAGRAIADNGLSAIKALNTTCLTLLDKAVGCQHGIGHGLMEYLGEKKLLDALILCETLDEINPLFGCTAGVFMEYNAPLTENNGKLATAFRNIDDNNPSAPCNTIPAKFQPSCYHELPQLWNGVFKSDFPKIVTLCSATTDKNRTACFNGMGAIVGPSTNYNVEKTIMLCETIPNESDKNTCFTTAYLTLAALPNGYEKTMQFCEIRHISDCKQ